MASSFLFEHFCCSVKHSINPSNVDHVQFVADDRCVHLSHSEIRDNSSAPSSSARKVNSVANKVNWEVNRANSGVNKVSSEANRVSSVHSKPSTADVEPETRKESMAESRTQFM